MKEATVNKILETGTELILKKGYNAVGLNEILQTANIPKGSFYYYFKSKEDFGLRLIEKYAEDNIVSLDAALNDTSYNHKDRIIRFFKNIDKLYVVKNFKEGCLLGNSSIELSDKSDAFATVVNKALNRFQSSFETIIAQGQKEGTIKNDTSPEELADFIITNWHGALLRMKSAKNTDSLKIVIKYLEEYML